MFNQISKSLLYIPYKKRYDIVNNIRINNKLYYCVTDINPNIYVPNSRFIWNKNKAQYDQYNYSLNQIYNTKEIVKYYKQKIYKINLIE